MLRNINIVIVQTLNRSAAGRAGPSTGRPREGPDSSSGHGQDKQTPSGGNRNSHGNGYCAKHFSPAKELISRGAEIDGPREWTRPGLLLLLLLDAINGLGPPEVTA